MTTVYSTNCWDARTKTNISMAKGQPYAVVGTVVVSTAAVGSSFGATNCVRGVPKCGGIPTGPRHV
eukprot:2624287-Pyramimonas_sp.AAC.1